MTNDDVQMTIRLEKDFHAVCKERADYAGQTLAEWIRRAMRGQLDKELNPQPEMLTTEELEQVIARILKEKLAEKEGDGVKK